MADYCKSRIFGVAGEPTQTSSTISELREGIDGYDFLIMAPSNVQRVLRSSTPLLFDDLKDFDCLTNGITPNSTPLNTGTS